MVFPFVPGRLAATAAIVLAIAAPSGARGQGRPEPQPPAALPAVDATVRLRAVLPAAVAERVLAQIAAARSQGLAADALEQRALKFAARGVAPAAIERAIAEHVTRQGLADGLLQQARGRRAAADEIDAGAEALRQGVSGAAVGALAKSAPAGRSLSVSLHVLGALTAGGLPGEAALARVQERLAARATDREIADLPAQAGRGRGAATRPEGAGRPEAGRPEAGRPGAGRPDAPPAARPTTPPGRGPAGPPGRGPGSGSAGGPPAGVPANGGAGARPNPPGKGGPPAGKPPGGGPPGGHPPGGGPPGGAPPGRPPAP